ncbi:U4/U6 small nuclear ribonucleoprotein Prp3, partial [Stegodyphus mimosarum]
MMSLTKEELKPQVDKTVQRFLGFNEPSLVSVAVRCLVKGYDQRKTKDKLSSYLDDSKAEKLAEQLFKTFGNDAEARRKSKKRYRDDDLSESKKMKVEEHPNLPLAGQPSPGQLTTMQIQEMMANAQKMIEERKRQMQLTGALGQSQVSVNAYASGGAVPVGSALTDASPTLSENKARIAQLTAMIQARLSSKPTLLTNWKPDDSKQHKPAPLILDSEGRTLDMTGKEVHLTHHMPTLKANIRAQKRAQFKMSQEKVMEELYEQKFFDPRVSAKTFQRPKKGFKFHERGKFEQLAQRLRTKAQLEKLQEEIAQAAKKTGISSATKLALIVPRKEYKEGEVPDVEWWDSYILQSDSYDKYTEESKLEGVTALVEHPIQMKSPCDSSQPVFIPLYLTKKERKKLRRQNRREAWKEKQEKIRLGLEPPPEPKVRMSNLMRVLGNQAVQDPTKVEAHVREQMAKRQKAHEEANAARKLTTEQKREKKMRKLKEDTSTGVQVALYRVLNLSNPAKKFKVEMNAKQLFMTGCVILYRNINIVVVEGGNKFSYFI